MSQCGCHWTRWLRKGSRALVWNHSLLASLEYCVAASRRSQAAEFLSLEGWHWIMQAVPVRFCLCPVSLSCTPSCHSVTTVHRPTCRLVVSFRGWSTRLTYCIERTLQLCPQPMLTMSLQRTAASNLETMIMRCDQRKPPFDSSHVLEKASSGLPTSRNGGLRRIGRL